MSSDSSFYDESDTSDAYDDHRASNEKARRANSKEPESQNSDEIQKPIEKVKKSQEELEKEFESIRELSPITATAYEPTYEDYHRDKYTNGQRVLEKYPIQTINRMSDETIQIICDGPSGDRVEDFWTECFNFDVGMIVMNCGWMDGRGILCHHYVPLDGDEEFRSGKIVVARVTDVKDRDGYRVQKLAVRHTDVDEKHGWYPIWHCQLKTVSSEAREDHEKLNKLKLELLKDVKKKVYLEHGAMLYCASGAGRVFRTREPRMSKFDDLSDVEN